MKNDGAGTGITLLSKKVEHNRIVIELAISLDAFRAEAADQLRRCASCGHKLIGKRSDAKYCSPNCRQQAFLHRTDRLS